MMKRAWIYAGLVLILASVACNLPFGMGQVEEVTFPDPDAETFSAGFPDPDLTEPVDLSGAQRQVLLSEGAPDRFLLRFSETTRQETWYYDRTGYAVTFRNGDIFTEKRAAPDDGIPVVSSPYRPWQFNRGMGLNELLAVSQSESVAAETLAGLSEDDLKILFLNGLDVGFKGDQVLYIRAIPLGMAAESGQADRSDEVSGGLGLTPVELAHQGTHTYQVSCNYSDGTTENYSETLIIHFTEEGIFIDGEGPFPKIAENEYGLDDDYGFYLMTLMQDSIYHSFGHVEEIEGESEITTGSCVGHLAGD